MFVTDGRVRCELAIVDDEVVAFIHFDPFKSPSPSVYKEWKKVFGEIVVFLKHLGVADLFSFIPEGRKHDTLKLQQRFGFKVIKEVENGTLTVMEGYDGA